jgi:UDP-N-acetylmuramoylalanine--D-glutamate ligase
VVGEVELASWFLAGRVVAITGTKGKSTTATLVGRMLEAGGITALVGGNIGVPLSGQVARTAPHVVHVVEASSFQLETIATFRPWVAVFLNFSPDHLDRHASVAEYAAAKARIFERQEAGDYAVVNADDPHVVEAARRGRAQVVPFTVGPGVTGGVGVRDGAACWLGDDGRPVPLVPLSSIRLIGRHLLADVLAAAAVAHLAGVAPEAMRRAVEGFGGLEHALEPVAEIDGVRFVNDSKATNVEAARRAIESFAPGLVVIMGGRFKGGDLRLLRDPLVERGARVVAIGEAAPLLRGALGDVVEVEAAPGMPEAVAAAWRAARRGGTVLLAPACASFDMFRDYAERGRAFKEAVARLAEAAPERT